IRQRDAALPSRPVGPTSTTSHIPASTCNCSRGLRPLLALVGTPVDCLGGLIGSQLPGAAAICLPQSPWGLTSVASRLAVSNGLGGRLAQPDCRCRGILEHAGDLVTGKVDEARVEHVRLA